MSTSAKNLMENVYQGVCQVTEANLKLQQELLRGWSRYWPGFSARDGNPWAQVARFQSQWSESVLQGARAQRDLFDQQFDAAISVFDQVMGVATNGGQDAPVEAKPAEAQKPAVPLADIRPPKSVEVVAPVKPVASAPTAIRPGQVRNIAQKIAVVTGAASGIGEAVARELANRGAKGVVLVDRSDAVGELAASINKAIGRPVALGQVGDTTDQAFRKRVYADAAEKFGGVVSICVPAAGITRDSLCVRINKETGKAEIYPLETFRQVTEVNLLAPIYWGIEMVAAIAEDRRNRGLGRWEPDEEMGGVVVFLGSVSSQGNKGQISYAVAKAGLEGAAATLQKEAIFHGVRCGIIHPGFTDTPMAQESGRGLPQQVRPALYAAPSVDSARRDCGCDLLHDLELGRQRRAVGRCGLASSGIGPVVVRNGKTGAVWLLVRLCVIARWDSLYGPRSRTRSSR